MEAAPAVIPASAMEPIAVPPAVAMRMLAIGETTLFKLLKDGSLESVKIGKARRISVASIKRLAAAGCK
jgi:excisionase family DNA binding protein